MDKEKRREGISRRGKSSMGDPCWGTLLCMIRCETHVTCRFTTFLSFLCFTVIKERQSTNCKNLRQNQKHFREGLYIFNQVLELPDTKRNMWYKSVKVDCLICLTFTASLRENLKRSSIPLSCPC